MQLQLCLSAVAALRLQASKIEKSSGVDAEIIQVFAQLDDNSLDWGSPGGKVVVMSEDSMISVQVPLSLRMCSCCRPNDRNIYV